MSSFPYIITNSRGNTVASVNPATTTGSSFPVEIPGFGYSPYGQIYGNNFFRLLENYAQPTAPTNPVTGMLWFNTQENALFVWDGFNWQKIAASNTSASIALPMTAESLDIDLTQTGTTNISVAPLGTLRLHPTSFILLPVSPSVTATQPAVVNLHVASSEDVAENVNVANMATNKHAYYMISGSTRMMSPGDVLKFEVTSAANGILRVKVVVFGYASAP